MKRIKSVRGVEWYSTTDGTEVVFIRYQSGGKQYSEKIGPVVKAKGRDATAAKARRVLESRRAEITQARLRGEVWRSAKEQARHDQQQRQAERAKQRHLLFEVAADDFCASEAAEYARPGEVRGAFNRLSLAFKGRYLDQITRADIKVYYHDRLNNTGPFKDWPLKVGLRAPETDVSYLSALYGYMDERGVVLENPCHRPRSRRKASKKALRYVPKHKRVTPNREQLRAMFEAIPVDDKPHGQGQPHIVWRALFKLCYYTGGRPESEPCGLTHGDVALPDRSTVQSIAGRPVLGSVTFRDTKTGGDRTVPLHPEVEDDLRAVMLPEPTDPAEHQAWAKTPIFRKRGSIRPMNRNSYKGAKDRLLAAVTKRYPELAGWVLRDLRATVESVLTEAGVPEATRDRIAGHAPRRIGHAYYEMSREAAEAAILALSLENDAATVDRNRGPADGAPSPQTANSGLSRAL